MSYVSCESTRIPRAAMAVTTIASFMPVETHG
jgi:hypothetical protein